MGAHCFLLLLSYISFLDLKRGQVYIYRQYSHYIYILVYTDVCECKRAY